MERSAQQIYQEVLDRLTASILSFNPEMIERHMALPHNIVTLSARHVLHTKEELHEVFASYGLSLRSLGLSSYRRIAHECEFLSEGVIQGHHTNHFEKDGQDIIQSYSSMSRMELQGEDWKITEVQSAIENSSWPMLVPQVGLEDLSDSFGAEQRMAVLQRLLDDISDALIHDNEELWVANISLPLRMISRDGPEDFLTQEESRAGFKGYVQELRTNGITDVVRTAIGTQMVGSDLMIATYRTYLLRRAEQVVPSWQSSATLKRENGKWRVSTILRSIGHLSWASASANDIEKTNTSIPNSERTP